MSPAGSGTGRTSAETPTRLLDEVTRLQEQAAERAGGDQSLARGAERVGVEEKSVGLQEDVVKQLMKEHPELVPEHLQGDPEKLSAYLLEKQLEQKREALTALSKTKEGAQEAKKEGWLGGAFNTVRKGIGAVGGHLSRNWGKYLMLAAALGLGWYYSDYILAWLKQMQGLVTQNAIDTGAAQVVTTAPTTAGATEAVNAANLMTNPVGPASAYPIDVQAPVQSLFTGAPQTAVPVITDVNAAAAAALK